VTEFGDAEKWMFLKHGGTILKIVVRFWKSWCDLGLDWSTL